MNSFEAGKTRQFTPPWPDSYCVATRSSITSCNAPLDGSAARSVSCLWSREVETKYNCAESGLHSTSVQFPASSNGLPQATSSQSEDRCGSGDICRRTTFVVSTSITTRWIMAMESSPGSGYFQDCNVGWPTLVSTRYMSPTLRWSCWKVAIFLESGDHSRMGRSLFSHP